jgi:hypothetical protein
MTRRGSTLLLAILACGVASPSLAETPFKDRTVGDWSAIENAWQHSAELSSREVVSIASTKALNGRKATLGISRCSPYSVGFSVETDSEFFDVKNSEQKMRDAKIVYGKTLPAETPAMSPIFLYEGDVPYFSYDDADSMVPAAKFMLCPSHEESPGCLTFSLKGFTAALKMVCPKR